MPRILPSDVVQAIDNMFSNIIANPQSRPGFSTEVVPRLRAIVSLVEAVPTELIDLDPAEYARLLMCVAALRGAIEIAPARAVTVLDIPGLPEHPIAVIREAMSLCPDEAPSPQVTELSFIADTALRNSIRLDISAAYSNLSQGEWKGATVFAAVAAEALLLWALQRNDSANRHAAVRALSARGVLTGDLGANPEGREWSLHTYVEVAAQLRIIGDSTSTLVRLTKDFRNLIHPGRAARLQQTCDRSTALTALAAVEVVARDLEIGQA